VKHALAVDRDVRGAAIEVIVKNGAITLRGSVRDEKAREKAPKLVRKVKGVTTITNELKLWNEK
jgi:osmotically-inducible protein OsmY